MRIKYIKNIAERGFKIIAGNSKSKRINIKIRKNKKQT
jgi:hypothetical protein